MTRPLTGWVRGTAVLLILLGGVLRLVEFLRNRPLWIDEAMLAINVGTRSFLDLARPLDFNQSAPALYLWLVKAATLVAGMGEPALRSISLVAGLAFTWLMWRMVRELVGAAEAPVATVLAALSPALIYFAAEFKPYGSDALVTAALLLLTFELRRHPERTGRWWSLGVAGVIGFLLSIPAALVMAGIPLALLADPSVRSTPRWRAGWVALGVGWVLSGLIIYWLLYRSTANSPYMLEFWRGTFPDLASPERGRQLYSVVQSLLESLPAPLDLLRVRWWLLILGGGALLLARRRGLATMIQVVAPIGAVLAAALLGKYPIANRLLMFLAPCVLILVAVVIAGALRLTRLGEPAVGLAGAAVALLWVSPETLRNLHTPRMIEEGRASARMLLAADPALPVYILPGGIPAWTYYSTDWRHPDRKRIAYLTGVARAGAPGAANELVPDIPVDSATAALRYQNGGRLEVIARRGGLTYREPGGLVRGEPRTGWAEDEVGRLLALNLPEMGVYEVHWTGVLFAPFRAELARRGVTVTDSLFERDAVALRIRFPLSGDVPSPSRNGPP